MLDCLRRLAVIVLASLPSLSAGRAMAAPRAGSHPITGAHVLTLTQQLLAVAPKRYIGSPGHLAAENFIKAHFAPEMAKGNVVADTFTASTPIGPLPMTNYIVKFPGTNPAKRDGIIALVSHYETNYPLKDIGFVGANDGASGVALLMEIAHHLADSKTPWGVDLVLFDGEALVYG